MPPSKRKRDPIIGSFFPFEQLPIELQVKIVDLACCSAGQAETQAAAGQTTVPLTATDLDVPTTLSLTLVSRALHGQATPILYDNVQITRPSSLEALQRTLAARPCLAGLVRGLYIGPIDRLDDNWWPLIDRPNWSTSDIHHPPGRIMTWLSTNLQSPAEQHLLPIWCAGRHEWPLHPFTARDCRLAAIYAALLAAQKDLDVDLGRSDYTQSKKKLSRVSST